MIPLVTSEVLLDVGQGVLLDAVTAYASVLANQMPVESHSSERYVSRGSPQCLAPAAGDVTPADVAQAGARHNRGQAELKSAQINLATSAAILLQVTGVKPIVYFGGAGVFALNENAQRRIPHAGPTLR